MTFEDYVKENEGSERKVFEESFSGHNMSRVPNGEYSHRYIQHAWEGWLSCAHYKEEEK